MVMTVLLGVHLFSFMIGSRVHYERLVQYQCNPLLMSYLLIIRLVFSLSPQTVASGASFVR